MESSDLSVGSRAVEKYQSHGGIGGAKRVTSGMETNNLLERERA